MGERHSLYIIVCFFALHGSAKGFDVEGQYGNKNNQLFTHEQCLTILATDLETYTGMIEFHFYCYISVVFKTFFQMLEHLP